MPLTGIAVKIALYDPFAPADAPYALPQRQQFSMSIGICMQTLFQPLGVISLHESKDQLGSPSATPCKLPELSDVTAIACSPSGYYHERGVLTLSREPGDWGERALREASLADLPGAIEALADKMKPVSVEAEKLMDTIIEKLSPHAVKVRSTSHRARGEEAAGRLAWWGRAGHAQRVPAQGHVDPGRGVEHPRGHPHGRGQAWGSRERGAGGPWPGLPRGRSPGRARRSGSDGFGWLTML